MQYQKNLIDNLAKKIFFNKKEDINNCIENFGEL